MTQTIQLQSIGKVKAVEAGSLSVGDSTVWNFGEIEMISSVLKETAKTITFLMNDKYERRLLKTRLVGVK